MTRPGKDERDEIIARGRPRAPGVHDRLAGGFLSMAGFSIIARLCWYWYRCPSERYGAAREAACDPGAPAAGWVVAVLAVTFAVGWIVGVSRMKHDIFGPTGLQLGCPACGRSVLRSAFGRGNLAVGGGRPRCTGCGVDIADARKTANANAVAERLSARNPQDASSSKHG